MCFFMNLQSLGQTFLLETSYNFLKLWPILPDKTVTE